MYGILNIWKVVLVTLHKVAYSLCLSLSQWKQGLHTKGDQYAHHKSVVVNAAIEEGHQASF